MILEILRVLRHWDNMCLISASRSSCRAVRPIQSKSSASPTEDHEDSHPSSPISHPIISPESIIHAKVWWQRSRAKFLCAIFALIKKRWKNQGERGGPWMNQVKALKRIQQKISYKFRKTASKVIKPPKWRRRLVQRFFFPVPSTLSLSFRFLWEPWDVKTPTGTEQICSGHASKARRCQGFGLVFCYAS